MGIKAAAMQGGFLENDSEPPHGRVSARWDLVGQFWAGGGAGGAGRAWPSAVWVVGAQHVLATHTARNASRGLQRH